jgi:hypothetical protein
MRSPSSLDTPLDDTTRERLRRFIKELEEALKGD